MSSVIYVTNLLSVCLFYYFKKPHYSISRTAFANIKDIQHKLCIVISFLFDFIIKTLFKTKCFVPFYNYFEAFTLQEYNICIFLAFVKCESQ